MQAAIVRWVGIIGEATSKITVEYKVRNAQVEWKSIESLRHIIVHEYFGVDLERIWNVTQNDINELKNIVEKLITDFDDSIAN